MEPESIQKANARGYVTLVNAQTGTGAPTGKVHIATLTFAAIRVRCAHNPYPTARFRCKMQSQYGEGPEVEKSPFVSGWRKGVLKRQPYEMAANSSYPSAEQKLAFRPHPFRQEGIHPKESAHVVGTQLVSPIRRTHNASGRLKFRSRVTCHSQYSIYSHALGVHGHAAGAPVGQVDKQDGVPGDGEYPIFADTVHAIELNNRATVPEWGNQKVRIALEQDAVVTKERAYFLDRRQTSLLLIR